MLHDYGRYDLAEMSDSSDDTAQYVRVFGEDVRECKPFVNIGAGDWRHPVWQNLDHAVPPYDQYTPPEYNIDLSKMERWPIEDGTIKLAFCSHTLEHLTDKIVSHVFREVLRVLEPGGIFRIVVPDMELAYLAYVLNDRAFYDHRNTGKTVAGKTTITTSPGHMKGLGLDAAFLARFASCLGRPTKWDGKPLNEALHAAFAGGDLKAGCQTFLAKADFANKLPSQHINWFTEDRLRAWLVELGFSFAVRNSYGQSISPLLRNKYYFDRTRPSESLYVEGIKT